jgi:hypothetical protein
MNKSRPNFLPFPIFSPISFCEREKEIIKNLMKSNLKKDNLP